MNRNVILRFDEENFRSSCIDGYKAVIKKKDVTLEEIKFIRDTLRDELYYVEHFNLVGNDVLEIQGGMEEMPSVESLYEMVNKVEIEERNLITIFCNKLKCLDVEISIYVSGLY